MIFNKILKVIQKYQEWKQDSIIKTEKIYDETTTQEYTGTGLCNNGQNFYVKVTLTGYVETHYKRGCKSYNLKTFYKIETNIPETYRQYRDILSKEKKYVEDDLEKVYYEYIHNVKQENDK